MLLVDEDAPVPKKRKKAVNYNSMTLTWLRKQGYLIAPMEIYNVYSNQKADGYGFIDFLCIRGAETLAVQACGADFAPHVKKMTVQRHANVVAWLTGGTRTCVLIGWRKLKGKYTMRRTDFWLEKGELRWKERS